MILQADLPAEVTKSFISEWGAYGAILVLLVISIGFLIRYIRGVQKAERERLIKEKNTNSDKVEVLYDEIKSMQQERILNFAEMKVKDHEIQFKMVEALKENTTAFKNHTLAFNKLMTKL